MEKVLKVIKFIVLLREGMRNIKLNQYIYHENYCELIINSKIHGRKIVSIDLDDVDLCKQYTWHLRKCYNQNFESFYVGASINGKVVLMHRLLINAKKGLEVDHIDGDKLNNRKENLRECTRANNLKNRKLNHNNKTGHKGVFWYDYNDYQKWRAYITLNGKQTYLGYFDNIEDAIHARKEAEEKHYKGYIRDLDEASQ